MAPSATAQWPPALQQGEGGEVLATSSVQHPLALQTGGGEEFGQVPQVCSSPQLSNKEGGGGVMTTYLGKQQVKAAKADDMEAQDTAFTFNVNDLAAAPALDLHPVAQQAMNNGNMYYNQAVWTS